MWNLIQVLIMHQKAKERDKSHHHPSNLHLSSSLDWLPWHLLLVANTQLRQAKDQRLDKSSTQQHATGTQSAPTSCGREITLPGSGGKEASHASIR